MTALDRSVALSEQKQICIEHFEFQSGEVLKSLKINYVTLGTPQHDANGSICNAVLLVHGTAGNWLTYAQKWWTSNMYGPGQPLDLDHTFVVISDNIGAAKSSKPSDGLRMDFPRYTHADVVKAQHHLVHHHLGIQRLHAVMGSSYGGRLTWQWAVQYPDTVKGVIPMIASPFPNAGRRGMQDFLGLEPLLIDPTWNGGDYEQQPRNFPLALMAFWVFVDGAEHLWNVAPTRERSWSYLPDLAKKIAANLDANDWIYELRVNDDFNAAASLESIRAKVLVIELSGDEMVPAELGHLEQAKQILGDRIDYVKIRAVSGYGHSSLPQTIQNYTPRIHHFIRSLDA